MYFYALGYNDFEQNWFNALAHEDKFSQSEMLAFVLRCLPFIVEEIKQEAKEPFNINLHKKNVFWYIQNENNKISVKFSDIYEFITDKLCENFGFQRIQYQAEIYMACHNLGEKKQNVLYDTDEELIIAQTMQDLLKDIEFHDSHYKNV